MHIARLVGLAVLAAVSVAAAPTGARAQSVVEQAFDAIGTLEKVGGIPIVVLERTGDDPGAFWYSAMQKLCAKTGDNWCEGDVQVLSDTTNLLGWSRVLTYTPEGSSASKKVCAILPPAPGISAGYVATGIAGGGAFSYTQLPSADEAEAYLYLIHAAACLSTGSNDTVEQKRSDAFAALSLTLIEGNYGFVSGTDVSPARKFAAFRNTASTGWAVSVGERILLDHWKGQAAAVLRTTGCNSSVLPSQSIDTQAIARDPGLPQGANCSGANRYGVVSDGNLWLWGYAGVASPPQPYSPFGSFSTPEEGIRYAWTAAGSISTQR